MSMLKKDNKDKQKFRVFELVIVKQLPFGYDNFKKNNESIAPPFEFLVPPLNKPFYARVAV